VASSFGLRCRLQSKKNVLSLYSEAVTEVLKIGFFQSYVLDHSQCNSMGLNFAILGKIISEFH
jgi:hypothetical protein